MLRLFPIAALALLAAACGLACAQTFPTRPVRVIVPLTPGGPVDLAARVVAGRLSEQLGQQFIVDNRPGAGGSVGGEIVARAPADGYTLLVAAGGTLAISPHLVKQPFDVARDLAPVSLLGTSPQVLVVHPSLGAQSVKDLIALARAKPGAINYATSGQGSTSHLAIELLKATAKIDLNHVPYKGAAPALTELVAGNTQLMITAISTTLPYLKSGRLRALGVTSAKRIAALPEVPTIAETLPGFETMGWYGAVTTARTPAATIARLHDEIARAVGTSEVRAKLAAAGIDAEANTPEQFAKLIREETLKWGNLIRTIGLKPQ